MRVALEVTGEWIFTVCRSISWPVCLIFPSVWKQVELHPWAPHLSRLCLSSPSLFSSSLLQRRSADGLKVRAQASLTESWPNGNLVASRSAQQGCSMRCSSCVADMQKMNCTVEEMRSELHMEIDDEVVRYGVAFTLSSCWRRFTIGLFMHNTACAFWIA